MNLFPRAARVKGCASTSLLLVLGSKKKATCPRLRDLLGAPGAPSGSGQNLRLCAVALAAPSAPPKTLRTLQLPPASQQVALRQVPRAALRSQGSAADFSSAASDSHPGGSLTAAERGSYPGWADDGSESAAFQMTSSLSGHCQRDAGPLACPAHPLRDSHPGAAGATPSPYLPAAEDLTLRSALPNHPRASGKGSRSAFVPKEVGRSVWARTREMQWSWVSRTGVLTPCSSASSSSSGGSSGGRDSAGSLQATSFIPSTSLPHSPE